MNRRVWNSVSLIVLATACLSASGLPRLELGSATIIQGQTAALDLRLSGAGEPCAGLNATIVLPAGVSLLQAAAGQAITGGSFTVYGHAVDGGAANSAGVTVYSTSSTFTNGTVVRLILQAASNAPAGSGLSVPFAATNPSPQVLTRYSSSNEAGTASIPMDAPVSGTLTILAATTGTLSAAPLAQQLTPSAGSFSLNVASSSAWTVSSNQSWARVSTTGGTGPGTVQVACDANTSITPRSATITVTGTGTTPGSVEMLVTQQANKPLTAAPSAFTVSAAARSVTFNIQTAGTWTAVSDKSWATVQQPAGAGPGAVTVQCAASTLSAMRSAVITVFGDGTLPEAVPVAIEQAAQNALMASPEVQTVSSAAGQGRITIQTVAAWSAASDQAWATLSTTTGIGDATLLVNYTALPENASRTATITITGAATDPASLSVTLVQRQGGALSVTPAAKTVGRQAGATSFDIQSPTGWTADSSQSWATFSPSSGTGNQTVAVNYGTNDGSESRTAVITVHDTETAETAAFALTQQTFDCAAPGTPTGVTIQPGANGGVQLTWPPVTGAASYRVYRLQDEDNFANAELIGTVTEPTFTDATQKDAAGEHGLLPWDTEIRALLGCPEACLPNADAKSSADPSAESLDPKADSGCGCNSCAKKPEAYYWVTAVGICDEESAPSSSVNGTVEKVGLASVFPVGVFPPGSSGDLLTMGMFLLIILAFRNRSAAASKSLITPSNANGALQNDRPRSATRFLSVFLLALLAGTRAWGAPTLPVLGGVRPLTPEEELWRQQNVPRIAAPTGKAALPAAHRNTEFLPAVGQQTLGTCVPWAVCYYAKTYQEAKEHNWPHPDPTSTPDHVMGTIFNYLLNNNCANDGSNPVMVARSIMDFGALPLSEANETSVEYNTWPTESMFRAAMPYRGAEVNEIVINTDDGLVALKEVLAGGNLAVITLGVYTNLIMGDYPKDGPGINAEVYFANSDKLVAQHALAVIGYDDNKTYFDGTGTKKGAFLAVNSWGPGFGVTIPEVGTGGFVWLSYDYVKTQCWDTAVTLVDRIGYQPQLWAIVGVRHPARVELKLRICSGDVTAPQWDVDCFHGTGLCAVDGRVAFDLTDYATDVNGGFWLKVFDGIISSMDVPLSTGEVNYFAVQHGTDPPLVSKDRPVNTEDMTYKYLYTGIFQLDEGVVFDGAGAAQSAAAWTDYDIDGWSDLAVTGAGQGYTAARLFVNSSGAGFRGETTMLPNVSYAGMAWGDYDNDGRPDLAVCGSMEEQAVTRLYRNTSDQGLVDSGQSFPGASCGAGDSGSGMLAWGDYDNDGDLDLAVAGILPERFAKIYRNDGKNGFKDSGIALPQQQTVGAAWADYDQDGHLDLLLWGDWNSSVLLHNDVGTFSPAATLGGAAQGAAAWGDYDNDGFPDLAITGYSSGTALPTAQMHLYHNDQGVLQDMGAPGITPVVSAAMAWGDYDNDGFLDLGMAGTYPTALNPGSVKHTRVYRNLGDGSFRDLGINGPGISGGALAFVDVDNDGDLDLFGCGTGVNPDMERETHIWRNAMANSPGLSRPNTPPGPPSSLSFEPGTPAGAGTLKWNAGTDLQTPGKALGYELLLTDPAGRTIACLSNAPSPLERPIVTGAPGAQTLLLENLAGGSYQAQFRAVDDGQMRSEWSAKHSFTTSGALLGDVNGDGKIDVADLVLCQHMARGLTPPTPAVADLDDDGVVTESDVVLLRDMLVPAETGDEGYRTVATAMIGPEGGTLATAEFELRVPAGAFPKATPLVLRASTEHKPLGENGGLVMYSVEGLNSDYTTPLDIRVKPDPTHGRADTVVIGTEGYAKGAGTTQMNYVPMPARQDTSGYCCIQLPVPQAASKAVGEKEDLVTVPLGPISITISDNWEYVGTLHFRVAYLAHGPNPISWQDAEAIADYFELEYARFLAPPFSFDYTGWDRPQYRINVTIRNLDPTLSGSMASSYFGNNYNYVAVNQLYIANDAQMRATAAHEFFHCVEALYDPRPAIDKARFPGPHLWLDEAASTYVEQFATSTDWVPGQFVGNRIEPFNGMEARAGIVGQAAQEHGYGMSAELKYLLDSNATNLLTVYGRVRQSVGPTPALLDSAPGIANMLWYEDFWRQYLTGRVYAADVYNAAYTTDKRYRMVTDKDVKAVYQGNVPAIGADLYSVDLTARKQPFTATDQFVVQLEGSQDLRLLVFRVRRQNNMPTVVEFLEQAKPTTETNTAIVNVTNLAALRADGWWLAALVANKRNVPPYTGTTPFTLSLSLVQSDYTIRPETLQVEYFFGPPNWDNPPFPFLKTQGKLTCPGLFDIQDDVLSRKTQFVRAKTVGPLPANAKLQFSVTPESLSRIVFKGDKYVLWTISPIKDYELNYNYSHTENRYRNQMTSATGSFDVTLGAGLRDITGPIYARFDFRVENCDQQGVPSSLVSENEVCQPVGYLSLTEAGYRVTQPPDTSTP